MNSNLNLRINPDLKKDLQLLADKSHKTLSNYVTLVLLEDVEKKLNVKYDVIKSKDIIKKNV